MNWVRRVAGWILLPVIVLVLILGALLTVVATACGTVALLLMSMARFLMKHLLQEAEKTGIKA